MLQIPIASISWVASIDLPAAKKFNQNERLKYIKGLFHFIYRKLCRLKYSQEWQEWAAR
jgi:hypothetical protein